MGSCAETCSQHGNRDKEVTGKRVRSMSIGMESDAERCSQHGNRDESNADGRSVARDSRSDAGDRATVVGSDAETRSLHGNRDKK